MIYTKRSVQENNAHRCANFDLMGIFMMLCVIMGHLVMYSGKSGSLGTNDYYWVNFLRSFCMMAVNVFVIRSGYFGIKLKWEKIFRFVLRTCFYTWLGLLIGIALGFHQFNIIKDITLLFPVITKTYWYITVYLALCILSPYTNAFLKSVDKASLRSLLITGFLLFYALATFCFMINGGQLVADAGYGIVNFIYLYCLGFYLRNYYEDNKSAGYYLIMFVVSCLLIFGVNILMSLLMGFYFNSMISYNTVFVLGAAVSCFLMFKNLTIPQNSWIAKLASKTLVVYIIHENPVLSGYIFRNLLRLNTFTGSHLVVVVIVLPLLVYIVSAVIDMFLDLFLNPLEQVLYRSLHDCVFKRSKRT